LIPLPLNCPEIFVPAPFGFPSLYSQLPILLLYFFNFLNLCRRRGRFCSGNLPGKDQGGKEKKAEDDQADRHKKIEKPAFFSQRKNLQCSYDTYILA
jgi:hypothetical protein